MDTESTAYRNSEGDIRTHINGHTTKVGLFPRCDICQWKPAHIDARAPHGTWGSFCRGCYNATFRRSNMETGVGIGQIYIVADPTATTPHSLARPVNMQFMWRVYDVNPYDIPRLGLGDYQDWASFENATDWIREHNDMDPATHAQGYCIIPIYVDINNPDD